MRKILYVICILQLAVCSNAQPGWKLPFFGRPGNTAGSVAARTAHINISQQLNRRLAQTFSQAAAAQNRLPANHYMLFGEPVQKIFKTYELDPKTLYPEQTFLQTSQQTGRYLAARNNRLFLQELHRMKGVRAQIENNLSRLQQEALSTPQPQDPMAWLSEIVPADTTQLFVGEAHGYSEIHQAVAQLVKHLHARMAQREIILFTEFLPENFTWSKRPCLSQIPDTFHRFFAVWDQLLQIQVPVVGLELPSAVDTYCDVRYLNPKGVLRKQTVWASLEGVRLRNERWKKTLARYRALHPKALFVIYTGADHSMYNRPFTLSTAQAGEHPFVAVLYPDKYRAFEASGRFSGTIVEKPMPGPLERLVNRLDFQRAVVKWKSADLPQIAGFDVRIKLSVNLENADY